MLEAILANAYLETSEDDNANPMLRDELKVVLAHHRRVYDVRPGHTTRIAIGSLKGRAATLRSFWSEMCERSSSSRERYGLELILRSCCDHLSRYVCLGEYVGLIDYLFDVESRVEVNELFDLLMEPQLEDLRIETMPEIAWMQDVMATMQELVPLFDGQ